MNAFANSLFHVLLSWMRALFGDLLSIFQSGDGGVISWVSRHWLFLAALLLCLGLAADAVVYLLRWRPQYVWRSKLYRLLHRQELREEEREFSEGFDSALPNFNFADTPIPDLNITDPAVEGLEAYYEETPAPAQEAFDYNQLPGADQVREERRRRSDRHNPSPLSRLRLPDLVEKGRRHRSELPTDARDAFHEPVYPMDTLRQEPIDHDTNY